MTFTSKMGYKSNILSPDAKAIIRLIEENELSRALEMLGEWAEWLGGDYWKEITLLKGWYNKVFSAEMIGSLSFSDITAQEQKIAWSVLCLVEKLSARQAKYVPPQGD